MRDIIFALLVAVVPLSVHAQTEDATPRPRVLIIGDSTYSNHTRELSKVLKGKVDVAYAYWNPDEIADTTTTIRLLDRHLGRIDRNGKRVKEDKWPTWDLIHFNCGLGDLIHRAPGMKTFRVMPAHVGGIRNTSERKYAENLDTLVTKLKAKVPDASLVWGNTTPIRASANNVFEKGSEVQYNKIAAAVMKSHNVPTNDMYQHVKSLIDMDKPASHGADPFHFDKKPIHMPIVRVIERTFRLPPMPETEEEKTSKQSSLKSRVDS